MDPSKDTTFTAAIPSDHKVYKRRWFMLILFMIYSFNGSQQWAQFTVINNLVKKYYNVTTTQVEWTANVFTLLYIILIIPALYLIKLLGVRYTMILGALGITIGDWIKVYSVAPDRFHVAFAGQCFSVSFVMLAYGLQGRFSATWFGASEISTAGVFVLLGDQFGAAFSYFFPTIAVKDGSVEVIGNGLRNMHLYASIFSTVIFFLILCFFQEKPKMPPSIAQIKQKQVKEEKLLPILGKLMKRPAFVLFMVSFGLNCSTVGGLITCLNELIENNFQGAASHAGKIGSTLMLSGITSSLIVGKILDKTRLFQQCANILSCGIAFSMIFFTWSLKSGHIFYVYLAAFLIGFFVLGYYCAGMQLGLELTYPIHEGISTAISFFFGGIFSLVITIVYSYTIKTYGDLASNIGMSMINITAFVITLLTPVDLKRQCAENEPNEKPYELKEFV